MDWFRDLRIKWKLTLCFVIMMFCIVAVSILSLLIIDNIGSDFDNALNARNLRNNAAKAQVASLAIAYQKTDKTQKELSDISEAAISTEATLKQLGTAFANDQDAQPLLADLHAKIAGFLDIRSTTNGIDNAMALAKPSNTERLDYIKEAATSLADHAHTRAQQRSAVAKMTVEIILVGSAMCAVLLAFLLIRTIADPMRKLTEASNRINIGDMNVDLDDLQFKDEVGSLGRSFAMTVKSWKEISEAAHKVAAGDLTVNLPLRSEQDALIGAFNLVIANMAAITNQFKDAVTVVSAAASEIMTSVSDSAYGANQTSSAANQTSAIVEEVRQTSHLANEKAKQVAATAQKTAQVTAAGRKATDNIIEGMNKIREQVDLIADAMVRLSEKSQSISSIIASVDDLAKQSNLLAVNASVEAARAGELGRGFGVVAQEVKNMAKQSKESTGRIRAIIAEMQQATNAAAMATELGGKAVDAALEHSGRAGESISVLAASVVDSSHAAAQISASSQQQLAGVDQVAEAMASIRDSCNEHLSGIKQVEVAVNRLNQIASTLQTLVSRYEIPAALLTPDRELATTRRR